MVSAVPASPGTPVTLDKADLLAQAPKLMPGALISAESTLLEYDSHYYSRRPAENPRPLPAVRVEFNDAAKSWFHLDPATGQIIDRSTDGSRAYRWLFNGLHSLDWPWLAKRRPLWDIVVCLLLTTGLFLSLTGVWLSWKRLKNTTT
jgi:uncharacterized iron-regulated membrane protein